MRLDKFLKVSRLIRRRTIAKQACDAGKVVVNGKVARASLDIKIGDELAIEMGARTMKLRVLNVKEHVTKEEATELYEVIE